MAKQITLRPATKKDARYTGTESPAVVAKPVWQIYVFGHSEMIGIVLTDKAGRVRQEWSIDSDEILLDAKKSTLSARGVRRHVRLLAEWVQHYLNEGLSLPKSCNEAFSARYPDAS